MIIVCLWNFIVFLFQLNFNSYFSNELKMWKIKDEETVFLILSSHSGMLNYCLDDKSFLLSFFRIAGTGMPPESGMSKGIIAAIVLGSISCAATLLFAIVFIYNKTHPTFQRKVSKNQPCKFFYLHEL